MANAAAWGAIIGGALAIIGLWWGGDFWLSGIGGAIALISGLIAAFK